jgi:FkbM family methyltransferase
MIKYPVPGTSVFSAVRFFGSALAAVQRRATVFISRDDFGVGYWDTKKLELFRGGGKATLSILGKPVELTDVCWGLHCYRDIFSDQIYSFRARTPTPLIIDCGANVGLSIIYFKYLYPGAHVVAFEPDPRIFRVLESNSRTFRLADVELYQKAVWTEEGQVAFRPDGSVGGKVVVAAERETDICVPAVRLRELLDRQVDFLKVDIEGAEFQVLGDCRDLLGNVEHLFLEYHSQAIKPQTLHELLEILASAGFRYHLKDANPIRHPFLKDERRKGFDLQTNIFAFRN